MFPLEFPFRLLSNETDRNRWVFDPFCGRGTTNFAARLRGLPSVGIDSSPVAIAIAEAKLIKTSFRSVVTVARKILIDAPAPVEIPVGPFWSKAYSEVTLEQICCIREELNRNCTTPARKLLRAIMLGALHGPLTKGVPSYFSNQSPRTFAPKPHYAVKFWKQRKLRPPTVDVLELIQRRAMRFLSAELPEVEGFVLQKDSRAWVGAETKARFSWIITSPPYYGMKTYIPDQWLRNWFLGGSIKIEYEGRPTDFQHSSPDHFSNQLRQVWLNSALMSAGNARLVCRFGGIHDRKHDCMDILKSSFRESGWRITNIRPAGSALDGRRQASQFGVRQKKHPRQEYDLYAKRH